MTNKERKTLLNSIKIIKKELNILAKTGNFTSVFLDAGYQTNLYQTLCEVEQAIKVEMNP